MVAGASRTRWRRVILRRVWTFRAGSCYGMDDRVLLHAGYGWASSPGGRMFGTATQRSAVRSIMVCGGIAACLLASVLFRSARAAEAARPERGARDVAEIIQRDGATKPEWYDAAPLNYPKTLDLSWPQPKGKWNPQVNVGQYLITVVYRRPDTWQSTAKLFHHIIDISDQNPTARQNAMDRLAHVYARLLGDYPRAAYWWLRVAKEKGE